MRKIDENAEPSCRCPTHRESPTVTHHLQGTNAKGLRFTPDMIRDQEMLVSTMSQQGIAEDLIKRQFERLLEEQCKQLRFTKDELMTDKADSEMASELKTYPTSEVNSQVKNIPSRGSYVVPAFSQMVNQADVSKVHSQETAIESQSQLPVSNDKLGTSHPPSDAADSTPQPRIEPSSLLKIRLKKEALNSSKRNNGLQEATTALKIIQDSKSKIAQDRLSSDVERLLKLNGTQERTSSEQDHFNKTENQAKVVSANGLENSRNVENPPFRRYHSHSPATPYSMTSNTIESQSHPVFATPEATTTNAANVPSHAEPTSEQANHSYNNENILHSQLLEPKVIGGFTYFANKSHCTPQISGANCGFPSNHPNQQISNQFQPRSFVSISH